MFVVGLRSLFEWRSSLITFPICFFQFTEGPMAHDQPTYASVPGIRVFGKYAYCPFVFVERLIIILLRPIGMMCVKPGNNNSVVRKPTVPPPPKRDPYHQSAYYQRYKKHATNSPYPESDRISRQTDFDEAPTSPTTITTESTENVTASVNTIDANQPPQDLNALPQEIQTRIKRMIDQLNVNTNNRQRRSIDDDDEDDDDDDVSSRSSFNNEMWPDVSWHEINRQIGDIH